MDCSLPIPRPAADYSIHGGIAGTRRNVLWRSARWFMLLVLAAGSGSNAWAQVPLIPANSPASFSLTAGGQSGGSIQSMTVTTFDGTNISTMTAPGWEVAIAAQPSAPTDVQLSAANQVAVQKGDLIIATFYYRRKDSASGGEANLSCAFQSNTAPFLQSFQLPLRGRAYPANAFPVNGNPVTPSDTIWRRISIPFTSGEAYGVGGAQFNFSMGTQVQTLDIVPVSLLDYGQTSVFGTNTIDSTDSFTNVTGTAATITRNVPITGLPLYSTGTQIQVTSPPAQTWPGPPVIWNVRLDNRLPVATNLGDTFVAIFWMRAVSLPPGVPYAQGGIAFTGGAGSVSMMADSNWREWIVPMKVTTAEAIHNTDFYFMFGGQIQTVQVAGLQLMNLGQQLGGAGVKCTLTSQLFDYPGRSLNDPWRADAAANIAKYREGPLTVKVVDGNGNALSGINVAAAMKSHLFGFGCQTSPNQVLGPYNVPPGPDPMFTKIFPALFQHAEMGSYKWGGWESGTNIASDAQALASLRSSGVFDIRAHNLIWPADSLCPADVVNITSASAMTARINGHIMGPSTNSYPPEVSNANVKSYFSAWDAINEPYDHNDEMQVVNGLPRHTGGETQAPGQASVTQAQNDANAIAGWLAVTRATDPYPKLFINDWGIETNINHIDTSHEDYDANLLTNLENAGAQVDGMGFESHFYDAFTGPLLLKKMFDRFATGLAPGHSLTEAVTEFEATQGSNATLNANYPPDIDLYTDYMNDYLTEVFSEPNFNFFDLWLTSDLYSSTYNNWTLLPQGEAWISLVRNQWWTNTSASTDASGTATITGFLGRYALTASTGAITKTFYADLPSNAGATVNLQLGGSNGASSVWLYEAERKNNPIYSPLVVQSDSYASGGQYVVAPVGGANNTNAPASPEMRIDTEASGTVNVWLRVISPPNEDTFWMAVDNGAWQSFPLADATYWHWVKFTTTLSLASGTAHSLFFAHGACGAELDQVLITNDLSYVPTSVTPPAAPTNLAATAGNNQVSLGWTAASGATSYTVLRSNTTGTGYLPIASGLTNTSFVDATAANGTAYYYVVQGLNAGGPGAISTEATATPIAPPLAPTGLVATAGDAQVGLTWTASTGAASYSVLRSTTSGSGYVSVIAGLTTTSFTDSGLTDGTTYYYVVTASNLGGTRGNSSEVNALPLPPVPAVPGGVTASAGNGQVGLSWNASAGATSYVVLRSTTSGSGYATVASGVTTTSYTDAGLTNGITYYYVVESVNLGGTSSNSGEAGATPLSPIPAPPTGLVATSGNAQVGLAWTASSGAASYSVLRSTTEGSGYVTVASGVTTTSYTDAGLANGTTYYYVVEAVNLGGTSVNSSEVVGLPVVPSLYWDMSTAAGLGNGSGSWDTGLTFKWSNSSAGTNNPLLGWVDDANAYFETGGTLTATLPSGSTIKLGSLTQAVAGTYLTVNGGKLQVDSNAGIVMAAGTTHSIILNSALVLNSPNILIDNEVSVGSIQLLGVVSETGGSRALTKIGTGTVTLGAVANTFSGGVTLAAAGQVVFSNNASFGTGPITFNAGTSLTNTAQIYTASTSGAGALANNIIVTPGSFGAYTGGHAMTFSGNFVNPGAGNGTFYIGATSGAASVTLSGDNHAYAGTLVYNDNGAAVLLLGSSTAGSANALWTLTGGSTKGIAANVPGSNTFLLGELTSGSSIGRLFNNQASGVATFQIGDATTNSPSFGGVITDGTAGGTTGVTKAGTDNQVLAGVNTFTGATSVAGGTLTVNGSLAAGSTVTVNAGATLAGSGKINGAANVASGGILAPGGSGAVGKLTLAGGLNLASGGVLNFDLATTTASDQLALTGAYVGPAGGTVTINLNALSGFGAGSYPLITGAQGISATSFVLGATPSSYTYQLSVTGSTLSVIVSQPGALPPAPTGLMAVGANAQVDLAWSAAAGAASYNVLRSTASGGPYATVITGITPTAYADMGLTTGTSYYYVVTATNLSGTSGFSNEASATPGATFIDSYWLDNDIGAVGQAGNSSYSSGTFTLNGAGMGVTGVADSLDSTYQTLVGDGAIIARVATGSGASGVMMRETLDPGARTVDMLLQTGVGAVFQDRVTTGGTAVNGATTASIAVPNWVKLARAGNIFTGYTSPDGVNWTQVGTVTDTMASSIEVGLAQSSLSNSALAAATFTNVAIVPAAAWASQDIGAVPMVGASYYSNGVATVQGAGATIYNAPDQFRYTYLPASGDCDITARVVSETNTSASAKVGVMIRASLAANAAFAMAYVAPTSGVAFQYRTGSGGAGSASAAGLKAPYWVRLVRSGNVFTAYRSPDGVTWTQLGTQTITMPTAVYIGLPVCSYNTTTPCTATFDNITADP